MTCPPRSPPRCCAGRSPPATGKCTGLNAENHFLNTPSGVRVQNLLLGAALMNTATLVGSLIFATVLVVVVAFLIHLMLRGWRRRAERQAAIVGELPGLPDTVGSAVIPGTKGLYVGSTLAPNWQDRVAVGDLGYRTKAVLTRYPEGIMLQRSGGQPDLDSGDSITAIRAERGIAGKADDPRRDPRDPVEVAVGCRDRHRIPCRRSAAVRQMGGPAGGRSVTASSNRAVLVLEDGRVFTGGRSGRSARRSGRRCSAPACPATRRR